MIQTDETTIRVEVEPVDYDALCDYAWDHAKELAYCFLEHCADDEARGFAKIFDEWRRGRCQSS